jgi:DNA repair protein
MSATLASEPTLIKHFKMFSLMRSKFKKYSFFFYHLRMEHAEDYKLITRTDAKNEFLLKDCDFDFREPTLRYIMKKNPRNNKWGDMKLYLRCQVEQRAIEVHEDMEKLEEKKEIKVHNLHKSRQKNYEKKIKGIIFQSMKYFIGKIIYRIDCS